MIEIKLILRIFLVLLFTLSPKLSKAEGDVKEEFFSKCDAIITSVEESYLKLRTANPNFDEHWYLSNTWLKRYESTSQGLEKGPFLMKFISYQETFQFSVLEPPKSVRALALFLLYEEVLKDNQESIEKVGKYVSEFNKLMEPVIKSQQNNEFLSDYKKKNPVTWKKSRIENDPDFGPAPYNLYWLVEGIEFQQEHPTEAQKILQEIDKES